MNDMDNKKQDASSTEYVGIQQLQNLGSNAYNAITTTGTFSGQDLTVSDGSGLTWTYDGTTAQTIGNGGWSSGTTTTTTWAVTLSEATKEELQKIMKNKEVQIEIDGEMKTCKLADLLETGYLTLKSL